MIKPRKSKLNWYVSRLSSMEPGEILYRLANQFTLWQERSAIKRPDHGYTPYPIPAEIFPQFKEKGWPQFFFAGTEESPLCQQIKAQFPEGVQATVASADSLLQNQINLFGRPLHLDHPINWFRDPLTRNIWPGDFWADIDIRDGETIGGVKWVRELNRHHHFVTLAKAYWLSREERFAQALCDQFSTWIEANPPYVGVNWSSSLTNSIRVINWLWALHFIHHSTALNKTLFGQIIAALVTQTTFISKHLSKFSSANNHLIGEAAGLAFVSLIMPWLREAKTWRQRGLSILTEEFSKQIYPDGVMAEQAVNYLAFDLDFYLLVWQAAVLKGHSIPEIWPNRLEAACEFICHLMDDHGRVPPIGDSDDGRVVELDESPTANRFRSILATSAVLLERPDFKAKAGQWDEKSHWLLGQLGRETFDKLENRPFQPTSKLFPTGGYALMRSQGRQLLFDCGPLGYLSLAAHGHADALQLLLNIGGRPIFIDPGTFAYREGGEWRHFFRGTSAHNTITIDNLNQSEMRGDFLWGKQAETRLLNWQTNPKFDLCTAEHNGYASLKVTHRRTVLFDKPDWLFVEDSLIGQGTHHIQQNWHFPKQAQVDKIAGHFNVRIDNSAVQILTDTINTLSARIITGGYNPIQGWVSESYGHKEPAPALTIIGSSRLPMKMITVINLGKPVNTTGLSAACARLKQIAGQSYLL